MIVLKRAADPLPGFRKSLEWAKAIQPAATPSLKEHFAHVLAAVFCTNGHESHLTDKLHQVAADGVVTPSYVCPVDGCTFHEFVKLEGWVP